MYRHTRLKADLNLPNHHSVSFSFVWCLPHPLLSRSHFTMDKDHMPIRQSFYTFTKRKCKARKCRIATPKRASWGDNQLSAILISSSLYFILSFPFFPLFFASLGVGVFVRCKNVDHSVHIHSPWSHSRLPFVGSTSKCISLSARSFLSFAQSRRQLSAKLRTARQMTGESD